MAKEADFYSTGEVAKALGIPESRVFGMLAGGELEGQQDEWARWRIPASAVSRVRRAPELSSSPDRNLEEDAGSPAAGAEAREPAAETTIRMAQPLWEPPVDVENEGSAWPEQRERQPPRDPPTDSSDTETTQQLPYREDYPEPA